MKPRQLGGTAGAGWRGVAVLGVAVAVAATGVVAPAPAFAWWRAGVWVGPGYPYRRPYYYAPPPIVVAPPPVYYAPPPVVYPPPPPPPPVYYPPGVATPLPARSCYTPAIVCPMEVARAPGAACYCSDAGGNRFWGRAR